MRGVVSKAGLLAAVLAGAAIAGATALEPPGADRSGAERPDDRPRIDRGGPRADSLLERVRHARTEAEAGRHAEAARIYRQAAPLRPAVGPWLRLSALQQAARAADTALVRSLAATLDGEAVIAGDSIRVERVRATFGAGDVARGLELRRGLSGGAAPALWVQHVGPALLGAGDTAAARLAFFSAATAEDAPAAAADSLLRLGPGWSDLAAVAEADFESDRADRGIRLLRRALSEAPAAERPRLALRLGEAAVDARRYHDGHEVVASVLDRGDLSAHRRAELELIAARSHLRSGEREEAEVHYRRGATAGGGEPSARAAYLLADMALDRERTAEARDRYGRAAAGFPYTEHGGLARIRLGFLSLRQGRSGEAAEWFRGYRRRRPNGDWHTASLYWEGRARLAAGDSARGESLYRRVLQRDPVSYYGLMAARRLEAGPWPETPERPATTAAAGRSTGAADGSRGPAASDGRAPADMMRDAAADTTGPREVAPAVDSLLLRMDLLREVGWPDRSLEEWDAGRPRALAAAGGPLRLAARLNAAGWTSQGIELGWRAFDEGGGTWTEGLLEAVFPLPYRAAVVESARRHGIAPAFLAALIRQESRFDPRAVSPAGAVGLMQIMPSTAEWLARRSRRAPPDQERLADPELNLALGSLYLSNLLERFDRSRTAALIAYNAGPRRYLRWRHFPEFRIDEELAVERIPFAETRRYVKSVLRNVALYRRLYGLEG